MTLVFEAEPNAQRTLAKRRFSRTRGLCAALLRNSADAEQMGLVEEKNRLLRAREQLRKRIRRERVTGSPSEKETA